MIYERSRWEYFRSVDRVVRSMSQIQIDFVQVVCRLSWNIHQSLRCCVLRKTVATSAVLHSAQELTQINVHLLCDFAADVSESIGHILAANENFKPFLVIFDQFVSLICSFHHEIILFWFRGSSSMIQECHRVSESNIALLAATPVFFFDKT